MLLNPKIALEPCSLIIEISTSVEFYQLWTVSNTWNIFNVFNFPWDMLIRFVFLVFIEIDRCLDVPCDTVTSTCVKTGPGTYRCDCNRGYRKTADGSACEGRFHALLTPPPSPSLITNLTNCSVPMKKITLLHEYDRYLCKPTLLRTHSFYCQAHQKPSLHYYYNSQ